MHVNNNTVAQIALGTIKPKGWMRNLTCVCGSKKKFKNCCYNELQSKQPKDLEPYYTEGQIILNRYQNAIRNNTRSTHAGTVTKPLVLDSLELVESDNG